MKGVPRELFAERFREKRKASGLTQDKIAALCVGRKKNEVLSRSAVNQWEKPGGGTLPTLDYLVIVARRMNASIDYMVGLTSDKKTTSGLSQEAVEFAMKWDRLSPNEREKLERLFEVAKDENKKGRSRDFSQAKDGRAHRGQEKRAK